MPKLFPPLEAESQESEGGEMLSPELRESFETLHAILRAQRRLEQEEIVTDNARDVADSCQRKRKLTADEDSGAAVSDVGKMEEMESMKKEELESLKFEAALAAAVTAEEEISRLTHGIAELEAMLLQQEGDGNSSAITFPHLPPAVPMESLNHGKTDMTATVENYEKLNIEIESTSD